MTKATVSVGIAAEPAKYMGPFNVKAAVADSLYQLATSADGEEHTADGLGVGTAIVIQLNTVGCNGNALTAGAVDVWVLWSVTL
jgi:hypothetical protein